MKAAVVATGTQTYTTVVCRGAMSISSRDRKGAERHWHRGWCGGFALKAEGGVDGWRLLSETLFLECEPFMLSGSTPR